jgi:hypothetical protein
LEQHDRIAQHGKHETTLGLYGLAATAQVGMLCRQERECLVPAFAGTRSGWVTHHGFILSTIITRIRMGKFPFDRWTTTFLASVVLTLGVVQVVRAGDVRTSNAGEIELRSDVPAVGSYEAGLQTAYSFALGSNEEATRLSGVAVRFHKTMIYGVSGLMSAIAAVMLTARLNSAQPIAGINYELDAIAATVIGGTSLMGGDGTLAGTLVGALIMGVLRNGLNLLGVSSFLQQIVIGAVIVVAVLIDTVLKRKNRT